MTRGEVPRPMEKKRKVKLHAPIPQPKMTYGNWKPTCQLRVVRGVLQQRFGRRVKRDWGRGCFSRTYEYEWRYIPIVVLPHD